MVIVCMSVVEPLHVSGSMFQCDMGLVLGLLHMVDKVLCQGIADLFSSLNPNEGLLTVVELKG